jgi:hypothetical protein
VWESRTLPGFSSKSPLYAGSFFLSKRTDARAVRVTLYAPSMQITRAKLIGASVATVVVVSGALAFGPVVRSRVASEAERRQLDLVVGGVRPGWFAVRLVDVTIRPRGTDRIDARVGEIRVEFGATLGLERVVLRGGRVTLRGSTTDLSSDIVRWRSTLPPRGVSPSGRSTPVVGEAISLAWTGDTPGDLSALADARDIGFVRDDDGSRVAVGSAHVHDGQADVDVGGLSFALDAPGKLRAVHAATLEVSWTRPSEGTDEAPAAPTSVDPPPPDPRRPPARDKLARKKDRRSLSTERAVAFTSSEPLVALPDLRSMRLKAGALATTLAARLPDGGEITVDALAVRLANANAKKSPPLTFGPGHFAARHDGARLEVDFSTAATAAGTPLSVHARLPLDDDEVSVTLEGGPVSLSVLGAKDGAAGLTDVDRATVAGKGRVALAADALTFDGELRVRGAAISQSKLASDVIRGLDVGVSARGVLNDRGELRIDDFTGTLGALHVSASGSFQQAADFTTAKLRFEVPSTSCQLLLDSIPTALLPTLRGAKYGGTFGARGFVELDSRSIDDMVLSYDVQDRCTATEVPTAMARERFKQGFSHRIYLPDGTASEETTGPGSGKWVPFGAISPFMMVAVLTTEDGGFYRHHGFSHGAIKSSIIANLKARRFVRGASTISMQLSKNLFLAREKTLSRKLEEVVLTDYLEQVFTKDELMELYLNIIEFGPNVYGIGPAAYHYFGRSPSELNLAECLFLSSVLPAPLRFHSLRDQGRLSDSWQQTIQHLMVIAKKSGLISEEELEEGKSEVVVFSNSGQRPPARRHSHLDAPVEGDLTWQENDSP